MRLKLNVTEVSGVGQVSHPVLILDDVLPDRSQSCPLTVVGGSDRAALMSLKLTHCSRKQKSERGHSDQLWSIGVW